MNKDVTIFCLARHEAVTAFVIVPFDESSDVVAHRHAIRNGWRFGRDGDRCRLVDVEDSHDLPALRAAHASAYDRGAGLEILMPGLAQCRHMQERVAVVAFKGQKAVSLDGVEPLYLTTQLNRPDVPAYFSLLGRHTTIPCCYGEILAARRRGATAVVPARRPAITT